MVLTYPALGFKSWSPALLWCQRHFWWMRQCWWPGGDATPSDGQIFQGWWYRDQLPLPNGWMEKYEDAVLCLLFDLHCIIIIIIIKWNRLALIYWIVMICMSTTAPRFHHSWQAPMTFKFYFWSGYGFPLRMTLILISASKHIHTGWDPSTSGQWGLWCRVWGIWEIDVMETILMILINMVTNRKVARSISVQGLQMRPTPVANAIRLIVMIFVGWKMNEKMHMVTETIWLSRKHT